MLRLNREQILLNTIFTFLGVTPLAGSKTENLGTLDRTAIPIGDDGFVFNSFQNKTALVQDMSIEGVHFNREWSTPFDIGWKSLAVNFSDLAALGARPQFIQVSLGIPQTITDKEVLEFYEGMKTLGDAHDAKIIGGDLCSSPGPWIIDVSCVGEVNLPISRNTAQVGDKIYLSGIPGRSFHGLKQLKNGIRKSKFIDHHLRPTPRLDFLSVFEKEICRAAIDTSDGLANDLAIMCRAKKLGAKIFQRQLPLISEDLPLAENTDLALWGGEDYELILAVSPDRENQLLAITQALGLKVFSIGEFTANGDLELVDQDGNSQTLNDSKAWRHF